MTDDLREQIKIRKGETDDEYEIRICSLHDEYDLTWDDITAIINSALDQNYTESRYRKMWKMYNLGIRNTAIQRRMRNKDEGDYLRYDDHEINVSNEADDEIPEISEYMQRKIELQKERVKISDERVQVNAYIRTIAREETIKEIALKCAQEMNSKKMLTPIKNDNNKRDCNKSAIVCLSDWHYGIDIKNYWNIYNPDVAKERVVKLRDEVRSWCIHNGVRDLHVVNLSDLIAGRIHLGLRLESRFDVITQIMEVSEILAELLNDWASDFEIHYYDCLDNHSRLEPNKKDAMDLESLTRIIPWYLKERLKEDVIIHENKYDEGIITFNCHGYEVVGVHGDHDKLTSVVDNMSLMTHKHYDLVVTAHLHHFSADEQHETVVVSNGSLMGVDTFAKNLRLTSKASQNLIIVDDSSPCSCIYRIILN